MHMTGRQIATALLFTFTCIATTRADTYPVNEHIDVLHYRFQLTLDDASDEVECSILNLPAGYRKASPPPAILDNNVLEVLMDLFIISFSEIDVNKVN